MTGIYVHIPFCRKKCAYCAFYSVAEQVSGRQRIVDAILAEAEARAHKLSVEADTIYVGGGTPSLLSAEEFTRLASRLISLFGYPQEFTIEVNPDDVTEEKCAAWRAAGVNRVSMGVQSLVNTELQAIFRRHDAACARRAYQTLRRHFSNVSLDIMFGLPGQTLESLKTTLTGVLEMHPEHISAYSLTYEERTALTRLRDAGRIEEVAETDSEQMFAAISETLLQAGYERYEISNYALRTASLSNRSLHNSGYWADMRYLGIGPGAHSFDGSSRRENLPDIQAYIAYWLDHTTPEPPEEIEIITSEMRREERILTRLRTVEGISLRSYADEFGRKALSELLTKAGKYLDTSTPLLEIKGEEKNATLALTEKGVMRSDMVIANLF